MSFINLKVTCIRAEGPCSRTKVGDTFFVRNACLVIPDEQGVCIFALSSLLATLSAASIKSKEGEGILNLLQDWQCPDSEASIVFRIEEE
jgi:uncharacterized repeat protein (TIGR04076 family)